MTIRKLNFWKYLLLWMPMCCLPSTAGADVVIGMDLSGIVELEANTAGQDVMIFATGCTSLTERGVNLIVQIEGGVGAVVGAPATMATPTVPGITGIDLLDGTIWTDGIQGAEIVGETFDFDPPLAPLDYVLALRNVDTPAPVALDGKLGTLTIDTTGISPGDYSLYFTSGGESTTFVDGGTCGTFTAQTLRVVAIPEPNSLMYLALTACLLGGVSWIRR